MRPAHTPRWLVRNATVLAVTLPVTMAALGTAHGEDIAMPTSATAESAATTPVTSPSRGITMSKVEAQFGAPAERHGAVGNPPITRWDYPGFSVFFEHDHVIHSVIR